MKTGISESLYIQQFVRTKSIEFLVCSDLSMSLSFLNEIVRFANTYDDDVTDLSEILAYTKLNVRF